MENVNPVLEDFHIVTIFYQYPISNVHTICRKNFEEKEIDRF